MDRRTGWGWIEGRSKEWIKEAVRLRGVMHPIIATPPLNTPLVRMDKGTIDCDGFIK